MEQTEKKKVKKYRGLTPTQRKFVKAKIQGMNNTEAYRAAGYSAPSTVTATVNGHKLMKKPHIQDAINSALEAHGATPEWAVGQLMKVAEQDEEIGAKRLAAKDILELHGWNKKDKPTMQLQVNNAFFQGGRQTETTTTTQEFIDGDTSTSE